MKIQTENNPVIFEGAVLRFFCVHEKTAIRSGNSECRFFTY